MTDFVHSPLLWGLAAAGVPVLIHLINMMRHRRVAWAAMEFLLVSQKRNRTWILLKQLLLLLMRMAAVSLIVLVVAQPLLSNQWGRWFGGTRTHHIVLLDDSFSMSDHWGDTSAFEQAKAVVQRVADEAARQVSPQQFTLLRFSHAAPAGRAPLPDVLQEPIDVQFPARLREKLNKLPCSQSAAGPIAALDAMQQLLGESGDEQRMVYLVSDFRARQWNEPADLRKRLLALNDAQAAITLIHCAPEPHANLALASLAPVEKLRAAGVPLSIQVTVQNFGPAPVKNVPVRLEEDGHARPALTIAQIAPGRSASEQFTVNFLTAGEHTIAARLESDAVAADNGRYAVVDLPVEVPVLVVDGDPEAVDARHLAMFFAPKAALRTGVHARIEPARYLSLHPLAGFQTIYLLNIDRLDRSAVAAVEAYLAGGGSVVAFLGERTQSRFSNEELYRQGKGFFPVPLAGPTELAVDRLQQAPDLQITPHAIFATQKTEDLAKVFFERYFAVPKSWKLTDDGPTHVVARLRNGAPLVVEHRFGQGRVMAFLTTFSPSWNNWAKYWTFWSMMMYMQGYLPNRPATDLPRQVGEPLRLELDPGVYRPQVRFVMPKRDHDPGPMPAIDAVANSHGMLAVTLADVGQAGFYEAHLNKTDGGGAIRRYAVNVDPDEGDLATLTGPALASRLQGVHYAYEQAATFQYAAREMAGSNLSQALLYALVVLLLLEQVLAWSATYHPPRRHAIPAGGAP